MAKVSISAKHAVTDSVVNSGVNGDNEMSETELAGKGAEALRGEAVNADTQEIWMLKSMIGTVVELPPEEFVVEEALNVRPEDGRDPAKDQERIEELARSLKEEGQIQDGSCYPEIGEDGVVEYHLFAGNRRRSAMAWGNANLKGKPMLYRARVFAKEEAKKLRRKAIHENIKRQGFSPIQFALLIQQVRKDEGWETGKDTKNVAKYFGVSPAQITEHEKLLSLPVEVQAQIAQTGMAANTAQFLAKEVMPEAQAAVAQRSQEIAQQEAAKGKGKGQSGSGSTGSGNDPKPVTPKKKHVAQAAAEAGALNTAQPLNRKEILTHIQEIADSPAYGHMNSPTREWARYFAEKFAAGKGREKTLMEKFDAMVFDFDEGIPYAGTGFPSKSEKEAADAEEERAKEKAKAVAEKPAGKGKGKKAA